MENSGTSHGLVTIIIPVYNVEAYLEKCLDSVIHQTYTNLDIITVNDGSTDGSMTILEKWASKDSRLRVITQANQGLSAARNAGLATLKPETKFISFVDSDDWLPHDAIQNMVNCLLERQADVVCGLYDSFWPDGTKDTPCSQDLFPNDNVISREKMFELLVKHIKTKYILAWCKLYRKEILDGFHFPAGKFFEDSVCHRIYGKCRRIAFLNEIVYHNLKRPGSITHSGYGIHWLDSIELLVDRINYLREEGFPEYSMTCLKSAYVGMREILLKIPQIDTAIRERVKGLRQMLAIEYINTSLDSLSFKQRLSYWANNHLFWLLYYRWKFHYRRTRNGTKHKKTIECH